MVYVENMLKTFYNLLFPKFCEGCNKYGEKICTDCSKKIHILEHQECLMCSHPSVNGFTHKICKISYAPEQTISMFKYSGIIKSLIRKGKYRGNFKAYLPIIKLYNNKSDQLKNLKGCVFVPIPISRKRLQKRGYNQCNKICKYLEEYVPKSKTINLLKRVKETQSQYSLKREERMINMNGAFKINAKLASQAKNQKIVIVDDISTTGSTLKEACKKVYKVNPKTIFCLTLSKDTIY